MTIISANLYKALKKAGIEEDLAEKASSEVAEATKIVLEQKNDITELKSEINQLKVMVGVVIALNVSLLTAFIASLFLK